MWDITRKKLRHYYFGSTDDARRFRVFLLTFDLITITFFFITATLPTRPSFEYISYVIAVFLILDYAARCIAYDRTLKYVFSFISLADIIVIVSLLGAAFIENLAFLRILRTLRLLRSYQVLRELREHFTWFRRHEEVIESSVNLIVFIFIVTAIVYVLQESRNDQIDTYLDALYFTVATLTTTGFGDITLSGPYGRALAVIIMVVGVGLFLRLIQTIFRPTKIHHPCPNCGLNRHDPDAVHCKHCGETLDIPTHGEWH